MSSVAEKLQRKSARAGATKQVRLKLVYIDFWSVVKLSFLIAVCFGIILVVATFLVWIVLNSTSIFSQLNELAREVLDEQTFNILDTFSLPRVMLFVTVVAALNVVVGTALGAVMAMLYNFSVRITGGLLVGFRNS